MVSTVRQDSPHWLAQSEEEAQPYAQQLPAVAEVAVVGGGVIGVATAYWLARHGAKPLLLEARRLAWGASGRNGGLLLAGCGCLEDPATLRTVLAEEHIDVLYEEPGHLALASEDDVLERFRDEVARRPPEAPPLYVLDRSQCEELLGMRISAWLRGGRWLPSGAMIDPVKLVRGLAAAAGRHGGSIVTGVQVTRIEPLSDGIDLTTTSGALRTRCVVVACGFRTAQLVGLRSLLTPARGQMLSTAPVPPLFHLGMALDFGTAYWRQTTGGAIVLGGCRFVDARSETTSHASLNPRIHAALDRFLPRIFPDLPPLRVVRRWAGIMDESGDARPVAGRWRKKGVWLAAGFGGHGLPPALGVGQALAYAIVEGVSSPELQRLSPHRFAERKAEVAA
jgi:gamma-glutamylputrescine oxidase